MTSASSDAHGYHWVDTQVMRWKKLDIDSSTMEKVRYCRKQGRGEVETRGFVCLNARANRDPKRERRFSPNHLNITSSFFVFSSINYAFHLWMRCIAYRYAVVIVTTEN